MYNETSGGCGRHAEKTYNRSPRNCEEPAGFENASAQARASGRCRFAGPTLTQGQRVESVNERAVFPTFSGEPLNRRSEVARPNEVR